MVWQASRLIQKTKFVINIDLLSGRLGNRMFQYAYLYTQVKEGKIPDVYIQDPKHFEKYAEDIKKLYGQGIGTIPYVSIHMRRGDYVDNPFYVDLTKTDYYEKAIAMFPDKTFLVFSDDPDYCKNVFIGKQFKIMEMTNEIDDLNLMASCENNIIANSSFSWWAGYLNKNPDKKVVAPSVKNWYTDGIERTFCPPEWIRI